MCSVVGCFSGRPSVQRFKLPEDPERRLEWVQFLATVNKQRFKESSWTDISICIEHFKDDCFENLTPIHSDTARWHGKVLLRLKPSAVPSLSLQSESDEPGPNLERLTCVEPVQTTTVACQLDKLKKCDGPTSCSQESGLTSKAAQGSPVPRGISSDTSDAVISVYGRMHPENLNYDLITEKAALAQMEGKYVVNEKRLLQLFSCKCPLCGYKVKVEKVTDRVLVIFKQQCLQCEYRKQWKSRVSDGVPTAGDQHLTGGSDVTPESQQAAPEIVAVIDEEGDPVDETEESSDQSDTNDELVSTWVDKDWNPTNNSLPARVPQIETSDETESEEEENDGCPLLAPIPNQLCTDCGKFFSKRRRHTCEHKIKPYSCNICGKRCVSEVALNFHSRVHDENYEHCCKYCQVTFKTKGDKINHEQIHLIQGKPYKCPDCSETFASNKERRIHLEDHRGPRQLKCHICGIEFRTPTYLQRHLAVHTGERPFKCSVCDRGFNQAGHLKSHMRLHTGERPYKCQHCDKCFNHNVSLKSHVQRYHTSTGREPKKQQVNERESDSGGAEGNGSETGADRGHDNVEEKQDGPKSRSTGRPKGRPKSYESGNLVLAVQVKRQRANTKTRKPKGQMLKRTKCNNKSRVPNDGDTSSAKAAARQKTEDSDVDPEERKKKRFRSQNSGKSSGKRRGRPRKNLVV